MKKTRFGWLECIIGVIMVVLGIFTFIKPNAMLTGMVAVYAVAAILSGARDIVFCCRTDRAVGFLPILALISGIVSVMTGIMLLAYPNAGAVILSMLIPLWFITHSIFQLCSLSVVRLLTGSFHYYLSLVTGIVGLVLGIMMLLDPVVAVIAASTITGIYLILTGINSIAIAFSKTGFFE